MLSTCKQLISLALTALVLAGCASPSSTPIALSAATETRLPEPTFTATIEPSPTPPPSPTATATTPPTSTPPATATPQPPTPTPHPPTATPRPPTATRKPTPVWTPTLKATIPPSPSAGKAIAPGEHPQNGKCASYDIWGTDTHAQINWCIVSVFVKEETGNLEFVSTWTATILAGEQVRKRTDENNTNMYLVDNLGNRYDHIVTNGAAKLGGTVRAGPPVTLDGVFVFLPAQPGAFIFTFYDDDQKVSIPNINLGTPPQ